MVGAAEHCEPESVGRQGHGRPRLLTIGARPDGGDPGCVQVGERVEQSLGSVVEGVVVRERDAVDSEPYEHLGRLRRGAEEKSFARVGPGSAAFRDAAFEIENEEIALARGCKHVVGEQRAGTPLGDRLGHRSAEHRVAR